MQKNFGITTVTLANGLRVIIKPEHAVPKVSVQLWYNVGSKDEQSGEKGLAHLLEHMVFKGTQRMTESDINVLTHKLSGYTNAFTSYDYTGYLFDFPTAHWKTALDMLADCMTGCTFKEDLLQSELKAVVQELKMYKDNYATSLVEQLIGAIFVDHPYHHPIIGYKHDLYAVTQEGLLAFYHKHYAPNNAVLVVVGDITAETALRNIKEHFESIPARQLSERPTWHAQEDLVRSAITLYRDVQRPILIYAWRVPGCSAQQAMAIQVLTHLLAGQTSWLYRHLVDEQQIATDVSMTYDDLFEHGVLFLQVDPTQQENITAITAAVEQAAARLRDELSLESIATACAQLRMEQCMLLENNQDHAYELGKYALATDDPAYAYRMMEVAPEQLQHEIGQLLERWLHTIRMYTGMVLPIPQQEHSYWQLMQQEEDRTDAVILDRKVRTSTVEPACYAHQVIKQEPIVPPTMPYRTLEFANGLRVLLVPSAPSEKAEIILVIEGIVDTETEATQGAMQMLFMLMQEGTAEYSRQQMVDIMESHGMQWSLQGGSVGLVCFKKDIALALHLLQQMVMHALLQHEAIEKVRQQMLASLDDLWDTPTQCVTQLARDYIYRGHPWGLHHQGTYATLEQLQAEQLHALYKNLVQQERTRLIIVSDMADEAVEKLVKEEFDRVVLPVYSPLEYPLLHAQPATTIRHYMNRDQVALGFAGLSITRTDARFDALQLFDQVLSGGIQLSMSSRLFAVREATGLFYTIRGSMVAGADKQPGMRYISTIVSGDRVAEADRVIKETILQTIETMTEDEFIGAQDALIHALIDQTGTQRSRASLALHMDRFGLSHAYVAERFAQVRALTRTQVCNAAAEVCSPASLSVIQAGRV